MAQNRLGGPGIGLPYPQALYPASLIGAAPTPATNVISLGYGEAFPIPAGDWIVAGAPQQWLDPVTGQWLFAGGTVYSAGEASVSEGYVHSDGQNQRVINPQGVATGAVVSAAGSGYVANTTTVSSSNSSVWTPVVGGALGNQTLSAVATTAASGTGTIATLTFAAQTYPVPVGSILTVAGVVPAGYNGTYTVTASTTTTVSYANTTTGAQTTAGTVTATNITSGGSGYTLPPIVLIPSPPSPGVPATATATISSGVVTGLTFQNVGAGYTTVPAITLLPNPYDPNYGSIVNATAVTNLVGAGTITAVLCVNTGAPVASAPTLTINGAGSGATASTSTFYTAESAALTVYLQPL